MDIVQGDFKFDIKTGRPVGMAAHRQMLDSSIAGEGEKVSDGPQRLSWNPRPRKPIIPDMSEIPSIQKYFNRVGFDPWPAWLYHPVHPAILIEDVWDHTYDPPRRVCTAAEAADQLGIRYVRSSADDRRRHGKEFVWEWDADCLWRPQPYEENLPNRFDYTQPGYGKTYVAQQPDPVQAQNALMRELVEAFKTGGQKNGLDIEALLTLVKAIKGDPPQATDTAAIMDAAAKTHDDEREAWEVKAREAGIKIDGRWSLDKLRKHVMSELEARIHEAEEKAHDKSVLESVRNDLDDAINGR